MGLKVEDCATVRKDKILSISQAIEPVDPLSVFQTLHQEEQLHFYWEKPRLGEAMVCLGAAVSITLAPGGDRFRLGRQFIQDWIPKIRPTGDLPSLNPRFCCSFTFFNEPTTSPFPVGTVFLPIFQIIGQRKQCFLVVNIPLGDKNKVQLILQRLQEVQGAINLAKRGVEGSSGKPNLTPVRRDSIPSGFSMAVKKGLGAIAKGELSKIVLAQAFDFISPTLFDLVLSLHNLRQRHPDCYIFSTSNGKGDNFIGASPERLIRIQNKQLITDALAGSTQRGANPAADAVFATRLLNSEKEKREHEAVSDFIAQRLIEVGLIPERGTRQLMQLNGIQHLWTPFYAQVPSFVYPLDLVAQLHPTPAVAGVPTAAACGAIRRYETFDRSLYGAPLGWLDCEGNSEFIVAIRSGLINGNKARLYGGAGIVAGSDPEQEFAEVQLKLRSLLETLV